MNQSRQREQLLKEARKLYRQNTMPAVHPRYRSTYSFIYKTEEKEEHGSTALRIFICLMLFVLFAVCDLKEVKYSDLNTTAFIEELQKHTYPELNVF